MERPYRYRLMASTRSNEWKEHWKKRRAAAKEGKDRGICLILYKPTARGGRIQVSAPANPAFNKRAIEIGGSYKRKTDVWTFNAGSRRLVFEICLDVYGGDHIVRRGFQETL